MSNEPCFVVQDIDEFMNSVEKLSRLGLCSHVGSVKNIFDRYYVLFICIVDGVIVASGSPGGKVFTFDKYVEYLLAKKKEQLSKVKFIEICGYSFNVDRLMELGIIKNETNGGS